MKLPLKELLNITSETLSDLGPDVKKDFRLEQVQYSKKSGNWKCVVSFLMKRQEDKNLLNSSIKIPAYERVYKEVILNKNLEVLNYKIYEQI